MQMRHLPHDKYAHPSLSISTLARAQSGSLRGTKAEGVGKYAFTSILTDDTSQSEMFRSVALPMVRDVIDGKNGLLFTYGVTNAGKTYTILVRSRAPQPAT